MGQRPCRVLSTPGWRKRSYRGQGGHGHDEAASSPLRGKQGHSGHSTAPGKRWGGVRVQELISCRLCGGVGSSPSPGNTRAQEVGTEAPTSTFPALALQPSSGRQPQSLALALVGEGPLCASLPHPLPASCPEDQGA